MPERAGEVDNIRKVPLGMATAERQRLMDVLLRISQIAMAAFDVLDADAISERDVLVMLQLPDYCNAFTLGIERHARARIANGSSSIRTASHWRSSAMTTAL